MHFNFEQHNGIGVLKLFGDYTARNASRLKKAFFVGLSNSEHLIMDVKGVSEIDDFFVEQIISLNRITGKAKKKLTILNFAHMNRTITGTTNCPALHTVKD